MGEGPHFNAESHPFVNADCGQLMQLLQSAGFLGPLPSTKGAGSGEKKWAALPIFHLWLRINADF